MNAPNGDDLDEYLAEQMKNPEFRALYEDGHARDRLLDALVQARKDAGLTQTEVARRLGVRQPTVSKFEAEGSDPQLSTIQRYARALGKVIRVDVENQSNA
jgi:DNA-binding XRE family transcriptional regulator